MKESWEEKRACERIPASIAVRFSCDDLIYNVYYGTVNDISENGILVRTGTCFPRNTQIRMFIYKKQILLINAKVKRLVRADGFYRAMGIQVTEPHQEYLEFVSSLR